MNNTLEQLHLRVIVSQIFYDERKFEIRGSLNCADKSAEITKNIAIKFSNYLNIKYRDLSHTLEYNDLSIEEMFEKFLKERI